MKTNLVAVALVSLFCAQALPSFAGEAEANYNKMCASCHGKNKKGNPAMAKMFKVKPEAMDLTGKVVQGKSDEDLAGVIADGKGKMPSYKATLSGDRIKELVKFLRSFVPQEKP